MERIAVLLIAYILGAVPFGLIIGKLWKGIDVRDYGSGNIGATNVMRALGPGPAAVVFGLDVVKGFIPVAITQNLFPDSSWLAVAVGMIAILGHSLSVFLRFKGGKGVATSLGVIFGLDWRVAVIGFGLWVALVGITRYVSLASIVTAVSIPILMFAFGNHIGFGIWAIVAATFVIVKHRSNMVRLLQGKENRWGQKVKISEDADGQGSSE